MTPRELSRLLAEGESEIVEFKKSLQEETLHAVSAFANTRGGTLLLGVNDSGVPTGTEVGKTTLREITDRITSCTDPRVVPDVQAVSLKGRTVIVIHVPEYPIKPVAVRGRCYRRVGDSNRLMSPPAVAEMHNASTGTSWDARPLPNKAIKDLNLARVRRYMTLATTVGRRSFTGAKPREVIEKLELVLDGHPTWASILLFGKRPQSPLTQATVHCGRFRTDTDIVDDRLIEGSIVDQIEETMDFLKKHINVRFVITGKPQRDQIWDYPLPALREAVVNAICHRDYGDNADIQIKVFDDHIRIWNPGFLPCGVTIEDLYRRTHASKPRNKLIAQVFYDLEIIERYGSGIQRMLDACRAAGIPEPTIAESTGGFLITFRKATGPVPRQVTAPVTAPGGGQVGTKSAPSRHPVGRQPESQPGATAQVTAQVAGQVMGQVAGQVAGEVAGEVTGEVTGEVVHLVAVISAGQRTRTELQAALGLRSQANFRERYLLPALATGLIERTIRDKPRSRLQRYRLTEKGRAWLAAHADKGNGETGKP